MTCFHLHLSTCSVISKGLQKTLQRRNVSVQTVAKLLQMKLLFMEDLLLNSSPTRFIRKSNLFVPRKNPFEAVEGYLQLYCTEE